MEYAQYPQPDAPAKPSRFAGIFRILKIIPYLVAIAATFFYALEYGKENPHVVNNVIVKLDVLGITHLAALERKRVNTIYSLDIPYEKKQALIDKTVFIGADHQMTLLSLGPPRNVLPSGTGKPGDEVWVYHFFNDPRPTMLAFEGGQIVNAYKGSQADLTGIDTSAPF